jgi:thiol:disulfide interchange protein DsbA
MSCLLSTHMPTRFQPCPPSLRQTKTPPLTFSLSLLLAFSLGLLQIPQAVSGEGLYTEIQASPSDSDAAPEVIEVFWYGCPDCGRLEPHLYKLMDAFPAEVRFNRMPAVNPRWVPQARAFYAADAIGQLDCFHPALTEAMQDERRLLMNEDALVDFAAEIGIDANAFRQAYHSDQVDQRIREATELYERFGIDAVPSLVINRRYLTNLHIAGTSQLMIDTTEALIEEALAQRQKTQQEKRR